MTSWKKKKRNTPKALLISFYSQCCDLKCAILGFIPDFGWTIIVVCVVDTICPHFSPQIEHFFCKFFFFFFLCPNLTFTGFWKFRQNVSILFQIGNSKSPSKPTHAIKNCHYSGAQIPSESFCWLTIPDIDIIGGKNPEIFGTKKNNFRKIQICFQQITTSQFTPFPFPSLIHLHHECS